MGWDGSTGQLPILVADDDEDAAILMRQAFKKNAIPNPIHVCPDGRDTVHYLSGTGPYTDRAKFPFPILVLLDIKMPGVSGLEVLRWLREHPECSGIPVIILTSSKQASDIKDAYKFGANAYFVKPGTFDEFVHMVDLIYRFWSSAETPEIPGNCG